MKLSLLEEGHGSRRLDLLRGRNGHFFVSNQAENAALSRNSNGVVEIEVLVVPLDAQIVLTTVFECGVN